MSIAELRRSYHRHICERILFLDHGVPNFADVSGESSMAIAAHIVSQLNYPLAAEKISGQTAGSRFEQITREFLQEAFGLLRHIRPGKWQFVIEATAGRKKKISAKKSIAEFEQYEHLAALQRVLMEHPELKATLGGDYLITPDILIGRYPLSDDEINENAIITSDDDLFCRLTPLRAANRPEPRCLLHASISCKWTIRSDRAQNIRTEGLNLIRNRKGHTPHIAAVTAEPLPSRLASLALGTGDLDCIYHFALPELKIAVAEKGSSGDKELLSAMIDGRRLRDISDLPLDLAI
jgi:hypothetical protein